MSQRRPPSSGTTGPRRPTTVRPTTGTSRRASVRDFGAPSPAGSPPPRRSSGPAFSRIIGFVVLALILGGLIAFVVVNQGQSKPGNGTAADALPSPTPVNPKLTVYDFGGDTVQGIAVKQFAKGTAVEKTVTLTGDASGNWTETAPQQFAADSARVSTAVQTLTKLAATSLLVDHTTPNLGGYGIDKPTASVTLTGKSGGTHAFLIGNQNPGKTGYYVGLPNDDRVWLVPSATLDDVLKWPNETLAAPTPTPAPTTTAAPIPGLPTKASTPGVTDSTTSGTASGTTTPAATTAPAATSPAGATPTAAG